MKTIRRLLIPSLLVGMPAAASNANESIYSRVQEIGCHDMSKAFFGSWRCSGPAGYVAEFYDEGNLAGVNIRLGRERTGSSRAAQWRGAGRVFGDLIEWRMMRGQPVGAVLRRYGTESDPGGEERLFEELAVFKLSPDLSCLVGVVEARRPNSDELARALADGARSMPCAQAKD
ncbi:hypothetical protein IVB41_12465 [Bradyrhizobium sp. 44]|uniref:hypothetical protein n=1 Tax=Bradyrhizobium sp. 44 TaxID=2782675 RepID=UPI001FF805F6|nr:hypothetical protein [Bradyrhizobium sp. 44]MCK1284729.1 hypothetical protein [Bradyrhizobium sp. 44]